MMYDYNFTSWLRYRSDMRHCVRILQEGSRSFFAASLLLPKEYRLPIVALYAFCREADDAVDCNPNPEDALEHLYNRLKLVYARKPLQSPVDRAFAHVVRRFEIPYAVPAALFEGFAWDVGNRSYETLSDVYAYSARVAGTVGTMMAMIMGVRNPAVLSRACDLGVAMQLTNIARDVGEDAEAGRLYLPRTMLAQEGLNVERWMERPEYNTAVAKVTAHVLRRADALYERAEWGISRLPSGCRPAMFAARLIYAEIGREVERRECDSVSQRAIVSGSRKLRLLTSAVRRAASPYREDAAPTLDEVRFLIDAIGTHS